MLLKSTDIFPYVIHNTNQYLLEIEENFMISTTELYRSTETFVTNMMPVLDYISSPEF